MCDLSSGIEIRDSEAKTPRKVADYSNEFPMVRPPADFGGGDR
jgi:hypothetical protein